MSADAKALELLGLIRRSGRMVYGIDTVAANAHKIELILIAADIGVSAERRVRRISEATGVQAIQVPYDKIRVGRALGLAACAVVGITDKGFADNIRRRLEAEQTNV